MLRAISFCVITSALFAGPGLYGQESQKKPEDLSAMQEAARELSREIQFMQEDIVTELGTQKERTLYRETDAILADLERFQKMLKPGTARESLYKQFDALDQRLHKLISAVRALGPEQRLLRRSVERVAAADEVLHHAVTELDTSAARKVQSIDRQARILVTAAQQLNKTAAYALGAVPGRGVLIADLRTFAAETERFQKSVANRANQELLQREFTAVNDAWKRAIQALQDLPPAENVHLLHSATQVDHSLEHLFQLLGLDGKRPRLIIRT
jgi:exonuclease VII large subunit